MSAYTKRFYAARSTMGRIRVYYNVPAKRGMRVKATEISGQPWGTVTGTMVGSMWLRVRMDKPLPGYGTRQSLPFHPLSLEYEEPQ
jgi:hypothetical protein